MMVQDVRLLVHIDFSISESFGYGCINPRPNANYGIGALSQKETPNGLRASENVSDLNVANTKVAIIIYYFIFDVQVSVQYV